MAQMPLCYILEVDNLNFYNVNSPFESPFSALSILFTMLNIVDNQKLFGSFYVFLATIIV